MLIEMPRRDYPSDASARDQALTPFQSFIVGAPAGSGKTRLLVDRFLTLLARVDRPESVVAMTFTRKAAAEMKGRIMKALLEGSTGLAQAVRAQDERRGWNLLTDPGRLQIQTIDSLCAAIVRQMPLVSESGGIGEVLEDASELYRLAARKTLQSLAEGVGADQQLFMRASLFFDNDIAALELRIASLLEKRDQWESHPLAPHSPTVDDFRALLQRAHTELRRVFRLRAAVDFTEITRAAITALGTAQEPSDLLYSLDYRIEHLMVDEFQDTSKAQFDLLTALTGQWSEGDGRTLFLVGDPSQSIYGFRAAEVKLFLDAFENQQLGSVRLLPLRLTTNFRSTSEIVGWIDEVLGPAMPVDDPANGAVKLQQAIANRKPGHIPPSVIPLIDDDGSEEAQHILDIIAKAEDAGQVAILVRSRAHLIKILPALRNSGIRYEAVEIDPLKEQQHVLDLLALTRALVHLADRVSWLACLRAPWCGLTLADLSALAEREPSRTIFDLLRDPAAVHQLPPEGRLRAIRFSEIAARALGEQGRMPLRQLIENTWYALGGPALLGHRNQCEDVDTFLGLLDRFEEGGTILDFSLLAKRVECLNAKPDTGPDCVRVMTIHAAKGLEFDTVIIPQTGRRSSSDETELLVWTETTDDKGNSYLHVAAQPQRGEAAEAEYKNIQEESKRKGRNEDRRLLYVACTRAINHLYLIGSVSRNKNRKDLTVPSEGTFLKMLWPKYETEFRRVFSCKTPSQASLFSATASKRTTLLRVPAHWRPAVPSPSISWEPVLIRSTASARRVKYEWVSNTGRHVGTVVHNALRRIASEGWKHWTTQRIAALQPLITEELQRLGVPRGDQPEAVQQSLRALNTTVNSRRGQWILSAHPEAESELAIAGRIGNTLITGTIDRTFRDPDTQARWIIDYKTSQHQGASLEQFLNDEVRRYRDQMQSYATLLSRLTPGSIHLGLYFPLLDRWREWAFAEEDALTAAHPSGANLS